MLIYGSIIVMQSGWSALHLLCKNKSGGDADLVPSIQQLLTARANVNLQTTVCEVV
ncbi:hypothetical protein PHYSODRAFT_284325 [Phytophthora sojae]|uniref:Uncharacterized protein n=1 Tax=Phytophthora sojae (strain P6497) TaxID=1094619 RepID=G4YHF3_PHYSP|nr:hypothetical protein PHYSODRAFT_284325 [Phytophthora sojae]EGZ28741.1 hypothetical protein PHYSODRAFT_284325 [Phytophthora sojae]|eukprot:XP_009516016.1 hypothetical protein PHYSODRAFT_284325 [Phytophthora sojae]